MFFSSTTQTQTEGHSICKIMTAQQYTLFTKCNTGVLSSHVNVNLFLQ